MPLACLPEAEQEHIATQAKALGLTIEVGTRGIASDHLLAYLRVAERMGSRILRVVIDAADHQPDKAEVISLIGAVLPRNPAEKSPALTR